MLMARTIAHGAVPPFFLADLVSIIMDMVRTVEIPIAVSMAQVLSIITSSMSVAGVTLSTIIAVAVPLFLVIPIN